MARRHGRTPRDLGKAVGRKAGKAGKKAGEKTVDAAKKIGKKLLSFLKKLFIDKPVKYVKIAAKKLYLKIKQKGKQKIAELVPEQKVPRKHRNTEKSKKPGDQSPHKLLRQASKKPSERQKILENPGLIDAKSQDEVEIKLKLADGGTPTTTVNQSKKSADKFFEQLGKEWAARWAYNQYGQQLSDKLAQEFNKDQNTGPGTKTDRKKPKTPGQKPSKDGVTIVEDASDWHIPSQNTNNTGKTSNSGEGYTSQRTGGPLPGTGKATVDTDTGDVDITTTSGTSSNSSSNTSSNSTALGEASGDGLGSSGLSGSGGDSGGSNGGN